MKSIMKNFIETDDVGLVTEARDGSEFTDKDVAIFVKRHLRLLDRLNPIKVAKATLLAFDVFLGDAKVVSSKKKWKFYDGQTEFVWKE